MELIRLENIWKSYERGGMEIPVLRGVSLTIQRGELVALVGASGSGKSTLMNILGCLDRPTSGHYWLDGREMSALPPDERATWRNTKIGFIFQNFNLLARTSALVNVRLPLDYSPSHPPDAEARERAGELLRLVGLADRMDHEPSQLSGGQQQRVAIARSLVSRPSLLLADEPTGNLDSRTAEEVLRLLQRLNEEEGLTVIIVTHDENVARHSKRIIRMKDGVVVDEGPPERAAAEPEAGGKSLAAEVSGVPVAARWYALKNALRIVRTALHALRRNVMRSALTCLGIVIGVAAVITMMEIGRGSSRSIEQAIASLGAGVFQVDNAHLTVGGVSLDKTGQVKLTIEDAAALRKDCSALKAVAPSVDCHGQLVYGDKNWMPGRILGTTPDYLVVRNWPVVEGAPFTRDDVRTAAAVCLIGQTIAKNLFGTVSPIGKELRLNNVGLRVLGILAKKGANVMGWDQDDFLLAPLTTIKYRVNGAATADAASALPAASSSSVNTLNTLYPEQQVQLYPASSASQAADTPQLTRFSDINDLWLSAGSPANVPRAIDQITSVLRDRHHIRPGAPDDFRVHNLTEFQQTFAETSHVMTNLLLVVALISLMVGGVGIMNIMLVSVTERTREIGIRMAVGATARDILRQFLTEAVVLCLAGGITGILLGRGASIAITLLLHWPTLLSVPAIVASVAVSCTVGIVFGYYPAWKAAHLDPIEALRYE
ncbi:MAG: ABC transporter permease [Verrucomicrobia bacterium]|nr:ABC transporter permease [Verrucomicrobiota bacterium]MDE3100100.1 ABC transporter permease [Verrucomicrobiota bacterium]